MTTKFIAAFQDLPIGDSAGLTSALAGTLGQMSREGPLTVRAFRDQFSAINRHVRDGGVQLVSTTDGQNVLVSVESLASLLSMARQSVSLAEALEASGFEAVDADLTADQDFDLDEGLVLGKLEEAGRAAAAG